MKLVI
jgi:hypothetical protein